MNSPDFLQIPSDMRSFFVFHCVCFALKTQWEQFSSKKGQKHIFQMNTTIGL